MGATNNITLIEVNPEFLTGGEYEIVDGKLQRVYMKSPTRDEALRERNEALLDYMTRAKDMSLPDDTPLLRRLGEAEQELSEIEDDLDTLEELALEEEEL